MEFGEKLQLLRKQHGWTQEQLAEKLYISRTAVSKWESGRGLPNIESLKCISKVFDISVDGLLSEEERLNADRSENKSNLKRAYAVVIGILDVLAVAFILLPLYGNPIDGRVFSVPLLYFSAASAEIRTLYWVVFFVMITFGLAELLLLSTGREKMSGIFEKISLALNVVAILFFASAREPYVIILLFLFFMIKLYLLIKQKRLG